MVLGCLISIFPAKGSAAASSKYQVDVSLENMSPNCASNDLVVCNLPTVDFDGGSDELLNGESNKNDYDWLLTPPGTPLMDLSKCKSATDGYAILSERDPFCPVQPRAAVKVSRFSRTQEDVNSKKLDARLQRRSDLVLRNGQNTTSKLNRSLGNLNFSAHDSSAFVCKRNSSIPVRSTGLTTGASLSSAQKLKPEMSVGKAKPSSRLVSVPAKVASRRTTMTASQDGTFSSLTSTKRTGSSIPVSTSIKSQLSSHPIKQPSKDVSGASSVSKAGPLCVKRAAFSRGNSTLANGQQDATSLKSKSVAAPLCQPNIASSLTLNSRSLSAETLYRSGELAFTKHSLFVPSHLLRRSCDIPKRASLVDQTRGKPALPVRDSRTLAGTAIQSNISSHEKSKDDRSNAECTKGEYKIRESCQFIQSVPLSNTASPGVPLKSCQDTCLSSTFGVCRHAHRRSFDTTTHNQYTHQVVAGGQFSAVPGKHGLSSFSSATNVEACNACNASVHASGRFSITVPNLIASGGQHRAGQIEDTVRPYDLEVTRSNQTNTLLSVKCDHKHSWLETSEHKKETQDAMSILKQGLGNCGGCESPLVCPHSSGAITCDLCNVKMRLQMLNEKTKASFKESSQFLGESLN